jgi:hypothetical protein
MSERHGSGQQAGGMALIAAPELARFVQSLYRELTGRAAGRAELERASELIRGKGRAALVATLVYGEEALCRQVRGLYEHHLLRTATSAETAEGVAALRSGMALDKLMARLLASPQYAEACGAGAGTTAEVKFISALFVDLLRRAVEPAELMALERLAGEGRSRVVLTILRGVEFRSLYVVNLYRHLLDRAARAEEVRPWVTRGHTGIDLQKARVAVLAGDEYLERWS